MFIEAYEIKLSKEVNKFIPLCVCYSYRGKFFYSYFEKNKNIILLSIEKIFSEINDEETVIFFNHNLNFIGLVILSAISTSNWKFDCLIEKMEIYYIITINKKKKIEFRCSFKILPASLENIVQTFKLEKITIPFYKFITKLIFFYIGDKPFELHCENEIKMDSFNSQKKNMEFCTQDVYTIRNFILLVNNIIKFWGVNITDKNFSTSSIALKIFFSKFNFKNIKKKIPKNLDTYVRNSYFGGRCEIFGNPVEGEQLYFYDYEGMYGQCMLERFPIGPSKLIFNISNIDKPGYYFVSLKSENFDIPVLPYRDMIQNQVLYINGKWIGCYWFEELLLFLENGGKINKIYSALVFEEYDHAFKELVEAFNQIRKKGGEYKTFGKLMINSIYGRFGMKNKDSVSILVFKDEEAEKYFSAFDISKTKIINGCWILEIKRNTLSESFFKNKKKNNSNVIIASAITSKARIKLYKSFLVIRANGGRVLYCDTDSIVCAFNKNIIGEKMGDIYWNKESSIKRAVFIAPKTYGIIKENEERIIKINGIRRELIKYENLEKNFYQNEENFTDTEQIIGLGKLNKRRFSKDKKTTKPITIIDKSD